jgi:PAS domain S-box-containing protein
MPVPYHSISTADPDDVVFYRMVDNAPDAVLSFDSTGRIRYVNRKLKALFDINDASDIVGKTATEAWPGTFFIGLELTVRRAIDHAETSSIELSYQLGSGRVIHLAVRVAAEQGADGQILGAVAFGTDISQHKIPPDEPEQQVSRFLDNTGFAFCYHAPLHRPECMPYVSPGVESLFALKPEQLAVNLEPMKAMLHPDDRPHLEASIIEAARNQSPLQLEFRIQHPEQGERWIELRAIPQSLSDHSLQMHGIMLDISERKKAHWRMELLKHAVNQSSVSVFLNDEALGIVEVNQTACRTLGYTREEMLSMVSSDINPDISEAAREAFLHNHCQPNCIESYYRTKTGRTIPVELSFNLVHHGGKRYFLSLARDISEHKALLAQLKLSEREFRSLAEHLPDNVVRWDNEGRCLYLNPALEQELGLSKEEVIGKKLKETYPRKLKNNTCLTQLMACQQHTMLSRVAIPKLDGEVRLHDIKLTPEYDRQGAPVSILGIGRDMTEFYMLQEALTDSEQAFRNLAENAPDNIVRYDREMRIRYLNQRLLRFLGIDSAEQIIGHKYHNLSQNKRYCEVIETAQQAMDHGKSAQRELQFLEKDHVVYHQIIAVPEQGPDGEIVGALVFGRDITQIRETEHRLQHFIDTLPGMAFALLVMPDGQMSFTCVSPAVQGLTGLSAKQVEEDVTTFFALIHSEDREVVKKTFSCGTENSRIGDMEFRLCRQEQADIWVECHALPEYRPNDTILWHGIMLDITERKQAEVSAISHLEESSRLQRLQTANELATQLAHELNQPLAAITSYAEAGMQQLVNLKMDTQPLPSLLEQISRQAIRAGNSIRHMRAFMRRGHIDPEPTCLHTLILRVCDLHTTCIRNNVLHLAIDMEPGLPRVQGVEVQIEQVILNLLRNAHEAIVESGQRDGSIRIICRTCAPMVQLTIHDNGPGFDPDIADRLFEPFASTKGHGLGVGLSISRNLVEAHGGQLWVDQEVSQGCCIHFTLPIAP